MIINQQQKCERINAKDDGYKAMSSRHGLTGSSDKDVMLEIHKSQSNFASLPTGCPYPYGHDKKANSNHFEGISHGFTLLEILLAITLASILMLGLMQIYLNMKNNHRAQESIARLQENARTASAILAKSIHTAGYFGCSSITKNQNSLQGYRSPNNLPEFLQNKNILKDTDVIVIQKADSNITHLTNNLDPPTFTIDVEKNPASENNLWLLISDCTNTDLFKAKNYTGTTIKSETQINHPYKKSDTEIGQFTEIAYFISETSYKDELGKPVYALYLLVNGSKENDARKQELVAGIKDMQISYGVDVNDDKLIENYYPADQVTSWNKVYSVQITLQLENGKEQKQWQTYVALRER